MRAADLDIVELLDFVPAEGRISLGDQRMVGLIMGGVSSRSMPGGRSAQPWTTGCGVSAAIWAIQPRASTALGLLRTAASKWVTAPG